MFSNIGFPGLILILIIALVIFGPSKLPEIGRAFGRTLKEFKSATKGLTDDDDDTIKKQEPVQVTQPLQATATAPVKTDDVKLTK